MGAVSVEFVATDADFAERMRHVLLPVKREAAIVLSEMRQNAKWAAVTAAKGMRSSLDDNSDAMLEALLNVRLGQISVADDGVAPLAFLRPFLAIITGAEASGPITAAALMSIRRLLQGNVLSHFAPSVIADTMHEVVSALTMCKFEASNPWHDQMVLCTILHTLEACMSCSCGRYLSDADVCAVFQASYRIGFDTQVVAELSELLVNLVKDSLIKMVGIIFAAVPQHAGGAGEGKGSPDDPVDPATSAYYPPEPASLASHPVAEVTAAGGYGATLGLASRFASRADTAAGAAAAAPAASAAPTSTAAASTANGGGADAMELLSGDLRTFELNDGAGVRGWMGVGSARDVGNLTGGLNNLDAATAAGATAGGETEAEEVVDMFGLRSAGHILQFLVRLIRIEPMSSFALDLIHAACSTAGASLAQVPALLQRLQVDLLASMLAVFKKAEGSKDGTGGIDRHMLMRMSHLMLSVYLHLRGSFLLQIEVFIQSILIPVASGKLLRDPRNGFTPNELVETAHECLVDYCLFPGFLQQAYAALDCRVECSNLFESICKVFIRTAAPRTGVRGVLPVNALAVKGLLGILHALIDNDAPKPYSIMVPPPTLFFCRARSDLWHSIINGDDPVCEGLAAELTDPSVNGESGGDAMLAELCAIRRSQWEKTLKNKLEHAIEQLNEDYKKGFQFMQVNRLIPDPMDSTSVAALLRFGRNVDKQLVGNFMGKSDSFNQEVLNDYTKSFPLGALEFDDAFRAFADTFKQPPESIQVVRFTKSFVSAFLEAHQGDYRGFRTFKCLDDFMTICLWHNSTWYNTNPQVPKMVSVKMFQDTMSESVSKYDEPDPAVFQEMYDSICTSAFPQGNNDQFRVDMPTSRLAVIAERGKLARGQGPQFAALMGIFNRDMFQLMWGSAVRSISGLLDQATVEDEGTVLEGLRVLRLVAGAAKTNHSEGVVDSVVATVAHFTSAADPSMPHAQSRSAFGGSMLAREAVLTLFAIAADYADLLRSGWAQCLDCIMRLHKLQLVPPSVFLDSQGQDDSDMSLSRPRAGQVSSSSSTGNLFGFLFAAPTSTVAAADVSAHDRANEERARECVGRCGLESLFEDTKFLGPEALRALAVTVAAAAVGQSVDDDASGSLVGNTASLGDSLRSGAFAGAHGELDLEVAEACWELLIKLAIRNRDRIQLLLPVLNDVLRKIVMEMRADTAQLTQRAVSGLLRVCTRLLLYRTDVTGQLMDCVKMLLSVDMSGAAPTYAHALAPIAARSLHVLMTSCAEHIHSHAAWEILLQLLQNTCSHTDAVPHALGTLDHLCRSPRCIGPANYMHVVRVVRTLVSRCSEMLRSAAKAGRELQHGAGYARGSVDLLELIAQWLQTWRQRQVQASALPARSSNGSNLQRRQWCAELNTFWHHLLDAIVAACTDSEVLIRDHAMLVLHRCLGNAKEHLHLGAEVWGTTWREVILPMLATLASEMQERSVEHEDMEPLARTMCLAINMVHKTFVAHATELAAVREWRSLWLTTLQTLKNCSCTMNGGVHVEVRSAVIEAMGGMIQTLHARKLLWSSSRAEGINMWDRTFSIAREVSDTLVPEKLGVA